MSQNNTIKKSDKKFIRTEKARIRRQFLDLKKQQELIDNLYKKFEKVESQHVAEVVVQPKEEKKMEAKKETKVKPKKVSKPKVKKEKVVTTNK